MVVTEKSWHVMTIFADAIKAIFLQVDFFLCNDALRTSTLKGSDHDNFLLIIVLLPKTTHRSTVFENHIIKSHLTLPF